MSSKVVYKYNFAIIRMPGGYVVYNMHKPFNSGHTHQEKFETCISLVKLIKHKELPRNHSKRFLESIVRLAEDKDYIDKIRDLNIDYKQLMEEESEVDRDKCE